ncbi:unnamed protein product [Heterobilharzia americana]|nr:unnamed protein product [Heterobilharzia americana]
MLFTYVKDETLMPLCITQSSQEIVCTNESKHARNLVGRVKLFPSIENVSIDNSTIESILLSNCEKHTKAIQKVHNSVKHFPTLSTYRFLYAEILSRSSSQRKEIIGPNIQDDIFGSSSIVTSKHLQIVIESAFNWLYYWYILKPISSEYSFLIGYSMTLSMLRALGLQPVVSLPKSEIDLELESIFIGSPMTFGELCRNILGIIGLSKTV